MKKRQIVTVLLLLIAGCKSSSNKGGEFPRFSSTVEAQAHLVHFRECKSCDLRKAELAYTDLAGVNLQNANLQGCDLTRVNLRGANLKNAKMKRCDLSTSTDLTNADLSGADLTLANLKDAITNGTKFCDATMPDGSKGPACATAGINSERMGHED